MIFIIYFNFDLLYTAKLYLFRPNADKTGSNNITLLWIKTYKLFLWFCRLFIVSYYTFLVSNVHILFIFRILASCSYICDFIFIIYLPIYQSIYLYIFGLINYIIYFIYLSDYALLSNHYLMNHSSNSFTYSII